jgi:hypothetical protein
MNIYILYIASAVLAHPLLPGCIILQTEAHREHGHIRRLFGGRRESDHYSWQ